MCFAALTFSLLAGCGSGEEAAPPETPETKASAAEAASSWSKEQVDAMQKALAERKDDPDIAPGSSK